ncbi:MAG: arsenate reductase family protein [Methylacidiphilales bacterium]|nr:arsenate reductase family protein [Candidatus Methylacidiphilales bacterium]
MLKVYAYKNCGACRKALQFLKSRKIAHTIVPIRETPPTVAELKKALQSAGGIRRLFNTSGLDYRSLDLKTRLPSMSEEQALALLSKNGNLVKRPFAIGNGQILIGFKEDEWKKTCQGVRR